VIAAPVPPALLTCPVCHGPLDAEDRALGCAEGHRFLAARQGYFNLLTGRKSPLKEDTAEMVAARFEVLEAGLYDVLADRLAALAEGLLGPLPAPMILDGGTGTGYYLRRVLERLPAAFGIGLDRSRYALRRAAKVPRSVALAWDLRRPLPVRDAAVDLALDVFAPRNAPELFRVVRPGGRVLVVTPAEGHLHGLEGLGLLSPHPGKAEAVGTAFTSVGFSARAVEILTEQRELDAALAAAVVAMGPAGHHHRPEAIRQRVAEVFAAGRAGTEPVGVSSREVRLAFRIQQFERP